MVQSIALNFLLGIGFGLWKLAQLIRSPQRTSLRWVVAALAVSTLAFLVEPFAGTGVEGGQFGVGPIWLMFVGEVLLLSMAYCLVCVFVFSAGHGQAARKRAIREAVPLVVAIIAMAVLASTVPASAHPAEYPQLTLAAFRLVANVYSVYAIVVSVVWMRRYARLGRGWLAGGLTVASIGLLLIGVGAALIAAAMVMRLLGFHDPAWLQLPLPVTRVSNLVFLAGLMAPGIRVRWAASRIWWRHLRDYHRLRPLWTILHEAFPEDALSRVPPGVWWDAVSLVAVNRRFYRRVIECRDGLVRASGRLAEDHEASAPLAAQLRLALTSGVSEPDDDEDVPAAWPVAVPVDHGLDADVRELIALSRELRAA